MPERVPELVRRRRALEKTMAKYRGRPFEWGEADCILALRTHLVAMGHRRLPKPPRYRSALGAVRALRDTGHENLAGLLDATLSRIVPARMLPGDVALLPGGEDSPLSAVVLSLGHKLWGWHEANDLAEPVVIDVDAGEFLGAWRA